METHAPDLDQVHKALSSDPLITDFTIVSRQSLVGELHWLVYVVPGPLYSQETLEQKLASLVDRPNPPLSIIPISSVPRDEQGDWDASALSRYPVFNETVIGHIEEKVRGIAGIRKAAAIVEPADLPARLHLSDLLPERNKKAVDIELTAKNGEGDSSTGNSASGESATDVPAISTGGDLIVPENAPSNLVEMLFAASKTVPGKSLHFHSANGTTSSASYSDLLERAMELMHGLVAEGLNPGTHVLFQIGDNRKFLEAFWACILGGFVPVPTAIMTDTRPETLERFTGVYKTLDCEFILSCGEQAEILHEVFKPVQPENIRIVDTDTLQLVENKNGQAAHLPQGGDVALMMLTSGSTGLPKGVPLTHRNLVSRSIASVQFHGFDKDMVTLNWMPLDHVSGLIYFHLRDVYLQCTQVHVQTEIILAKPARWLDLLDKYRVTVTFAPNFAFGLVCNIEDELAGGDWDLSCLRLILNGGESVVASTARKFLSIFGQWGLAKEVMCPAWGMSEISSGITYGTDFSLESTSDSDAYVEVGYPIPGDSLRIVDENDRLLMEGEVGRLQVKGETVFKGYYGRNDADNQVFTKDGWFITGDLGLIRNGSLTITGREKDIIILNGVNYAGPRIESVVEKVEGVLASFTAAIAVPNLDGDGTECLGIFFSPLNADDRSLELQIRKIKDQVFREEGILPAYVVPLPREEVPKTSIGKIQRPQLVERFKNGEFEKIVKRIDLLLGNANTVPSWFFQPDWQTKSAGSGARISRNDSNAVIIFSEAMDGIASSFSEALNNSGSITILVGGGTEFEKLDKFRYRHNLETADGYQRLIDALQEEGIQPGVVVFDFTSTDTEIQNAQGLYADTLSACNRFVCGSRAVVQLASTSNATIKLLVLNRGWSSFGKFQGSTSLGAPILSLVKSLSLENMSITCASVDVGEFDSATASDCVIEELNSGLPDVEVAFRSGRRHVMALQRVKLSQTAGSGSLKPHGHYLVSGGLGGVGFNLVSYLLKQYDACIVITGREDLQPDTERYNKYEELKKLPGSVLYVRSDLCEPALLEQAFSALTNSTSISLDGIFHLAGSYHESLVIDETRESLDQLFSPKVNGSQTLLELASRNPECFFVGFSSVSSLFGGAMIGGYSASNLFLDQLASRREEGARVYSINWATWRDTGISREFEFKDALQASGYMEMPVDSALRSLEIILSQQPGNYIVGLDICNQRIRSRMSESSVLIKMRCYCELESGETSGSLPQISQEDDYGTSISAELVYLPQLPVTDSGAIDRKALIAMYQNGSSRIVPPSTPVEEQLASIWQNLLGINEVSVDWSFFELGGQSLLATKLNSELASRFGVDWSLRNIFELPTLKEQAQRIERESGALTSVARDDSAISGNLALGLSSSQKRMWFMDQFSTARHMYNISAALQIEGHLDEGMLAESIQRVIMRHEALRTTFPKEDGQPIQKIAASLHIEVPVCDLSPLDDEAKKKELSELGKKEACREFDLEKGPLLRALLIRMAPNEYTFMVTMHHIISDGWSIQIFFRDLLEYYQSYSKEDMSPPRDLTYQYSDYARWQSQWQASSDFNSKCEYWIEKLRGVGVGLEIPTDKPRPELQTYRGQRYLTHLPATLSVRLEDYARNQNVSLYMVLLTAFQILLYRRSRQEDVVIGTVTANRNKTELNDLIGSFVNLFVLRTQLDGKASFCETLKEVRTAALEAFEFMDIPFEVIVDKLQASRDLSRAPVFQIAFDFREPFLTKSPMPGIKLGLMEPDLGISKYDLHLTIEAQDNGLKVIWEYATDLFYEESIAQMAEQYRVLLENILEDPQQVIEEILLFSKPELQEHVKSCRGVERSEYLDGASVLSLIESQAERNPMQTAVEYDGQSISYEELNKKSSQLAGYLQKNGVGIGTMVAISLNRNPNMVIAMLGVMKAGGAYVPLDPKYPLDRIEFILRKSKAPLILTEEQLAEKFKSLGVSLFELDKDWSMVEAHPVVSPRIKIEPEQLAYSIFTSGSTGQPKGVLLQHWGLLNLACSAKAALRITSDSRVLQFSSFGFDASVWEIFTTLAAGATLCLGKDSELLPGMDLINFLVSKNISVATLPPSVLRVLPEAELPALKTIVSAGEACSLELVNRWADSRLFINAYGPTETTVCATMGEVIPDADGNSPDIGYPLPNMAVYLVDDKLQPVPPGVPGELCVSGVGLARGYLGLSELTSEKFVENPYGSGIYTRMYRTGDLALRKVDGRISYIGRIDNQVKLRGFRIELGEIEHVLRQSPQVDDAAVLLREDNPGDRKLVGYVVLNTALNSIDRSGGESKPLGDTRILKQDIKDILARQLPEYMHPNIIEFLDSMPLTSNGKIDRNALPVPDQARSGLDIGVTDPTSTLEGEIVDIWKQLLGLEVVGIEQNFFDIGGDSLKMAEVQHQVLSRIGRKIELVELFQYPTVRTLAAYLESNKNSRPTEKQVDLAAKERSNTGKQRMLDLAKRKQDARNRTRKPL
ncbi:MAG: amino acid adenylation domain-containing protein [Gammaproteobacteria bacterium]